MLESFITNLKAASSSQRDSMIKDIDFLDHYETNSGATGSVSAEGVDDHDESAAAASIQESGEGKPYSYSTLPHSHFVVSPQ